MIDRLSISFPTVSRPSPYSLPARPHANSRYPRQVCRHHRNSVNEIDRSVNRVIVDLMHARPPMHVTSRCSLVARSSTPPADDDTSGVGADGNAGTVPSTNWLITLAYKLRPRAGPGDDRVGTVTRGGPVEWRREQSPVR